MIEGMIGKKVGMTQLFDEDGRVTPVTVLEMGPCVVVQRKSMDKDGYEAVQVGLVDPKAGKRANKPMRGHHEKASVPPTRILREFALEEGDDPKPGDALLVEMFQDVPKVDIIGTSKGKGFQGVIKRWGFGGGKASHGSMHHRAPGSIGQSAWPAKVFRGVKMPGQMGNKRITVKNLKVVRIDNEKNLMLVKGGVPGAPGSTIMIRKSK
ncbi:MAG: 50S ribosomal protein L3 [Acidobacteria bacterium]|uniref:Large ribosomal subunit protein uL3 n=1 Tax=Candidatus Polarisedimenticola svalbardensis TaxID=2886004 RepID=A0A8J7CCP9_9BACT|nr:50S ribosomal protein L3 [Candidatus Polarisedimenticola svalbardensis]